MGRILIIAKGISQALARQLTPPTNRERTARSFLLALLGQKTWRHPLISEFDVKQEIAKINKMSLTPLGKARRLLRLARRVRVATQKLIHLSGALMQDSYGEQSVSLHAAAKRLTAIHDDVRMQARALLDLEKQPLAFNYVAPGTAYPAWNLAD